MKRGNKVHKYLEDELSRQREQEVQRPSSGNLLGCSKYQEAGVTGGGRKGNGELGGAADQAGPC